MKHESFHILSDVSLLDPKAHRPILKLVFQCTYAICLYVEDDYPLRVLEGTKTLIGQSFVLSHDGDNVRVVKIGGK